MRRARKQSGYILLPVIVVITLVAAIALLMNTESALESNTTASELDAQQAQYVAAAGLNNALWLTAQQGCGAYSDLANVTLGSASYATSLTTDLGGTTPYTITVDQDSWIRSDNPTDTHAVDDRLNIHNGGGSIERPLYRYDLSSLGSKVSILSATAWFYVSKDHAEGPVDLHRITADWSDADANWDSMGAHMDDVVLASIPAQANADVWVPVNLTGQVQAWVNGQPNYGITFNAVIDGIDGEYASRESANPPWLEVVVGTQPSSPALLKSVATLANGVTRVITRQDVILYQHPSGMRLLQPGAADGEDAEIWEQSPNNNYGAAAETWVSSAASDTTRSLLQFNMGEIPIGARILSANLSLERRSGSGADQPVSAHRILNPWSEDSVTWNRRQTGINWDTAGSDFDSTAVTTTPVGPANQRYAWDLTPLVQGWVDGSYPNHGVVLVAAVPGMAGERFYTSDDSDPSTWPSLSISYSCACGVVCSAPQGSGRIVMVGNWPGPNPDPRDLEKEAVIESWGYQVDQWDDNFIWSIDFNDYDLVYISETTSSGAVTGQLSWRSIAIVNEQGNLNADLGFSTNKNTTTGDSIEITDNSHFISLPFALGELPIYNAPMEILTAGGTRATELTVLGEAGGSESLMLLDVGAAGVNGPAPGRRVSLPLGRATNSNFNWAHLNNNGRLLVQRAIKWGMGKDKFSEGNLLLVVVNPGSLTTQETAKKTLFESWGYAVNPIDESDSQANFDTALAANDVVYITEDVSSGNVNTKLVDAAIGVVTEEDNLSDEFGMSDGIHWGSGTSLTIDNSHYITQPLAAGNVTIFTTTESQADLTGALAPDLRVIGSSTDGPALATLDTGAALNGGGNAAGRRVFLPWGGDSMNINHLNDDGRIILLRSLEWAAGASLGMSPLAHWKLDEISGFTAVDSEGGHDGTLAGDPGWSSGILGGALDFDGSGDRVDASGILDAGTSRISVTAWVLKRDLGDDRIIAKSSGTSIPDHVFSLGVAGDVIRVRLRTTDNGGSSDYDAGPIPLNQWVHLAFTYDGSQLRIYRDGVETGSYAVTGDMIASTVQASIGNVNPTDDRYWNGLLDDVRVYDRMLATDEIEALATPPGPVAHWKLDDGAGLTAIDSDGGHDGTLTNGPAWVAGALGDALDFDGSNDYVAAGSFDVSGSGITMMGWFNAEAIATDDGRIVSKASGPNEADAWWQLSTTDVGASRFLRMRIKAGGATTTFADNSVSLVTDQWYFAVATYDAATGSMKLYLDGIEVASATHAVGGTLDINPTVPVALGANGTAERFFNGILDDVRIYDYALPASEIADIYAANPPPGAVSYTELYQQWSASVEKEWQTVNLGVYGVPANAVVEIALLNAKTSNERSAGVRAVGSTLERRFDLAEAESGGFEAITMHVQADASSQIQHYVEKVDDISFILLGYWSGATYVELFEPFGANTSNNWVVEDVSDEGLGANQVAEIVIANTDQGAERLAGVRTPGSSLQRRFDIHEAESGGIDAVSLMVLTNAAAEVEAFAENAADIEFHVVGYWSTPPGIYTENGGVRGQVSTLLTWETSSLASFGVPANAIAQFLITNEAASAEVEVGVRQTGSALNRIIDIQEAESGGSDATSLHVNVDAGGNIEWYAQYGGGTRFFYPVGWWVLSP